MRTMWLIVISLVGVVGGGCVQQPPVEGARSAADPRPQTATPGETLEANRIRLTGASTIAPLMTEIGKRFEERHPEIRVDVQSGGSSRGVTDAKERLCDLGMVSRDLHADEKLALQQIPLALDGIGMIVHADNPVRELSREQIIDIYTGQARLWSEVGGGEGQITVVMKAAGRSTAELFLHHFQLSSRDVQPSVIIGENEQAIRTVTASRQALGYVSIGSAEYAIAQGLPIRLLPLEGIAASSENVRRGTYPLKRRLHLVVPQAPTGVLKTFVAFATSDEVYDLIQRFSFVPCLPERMSHE